MRKARKSTKRLLMSSFILILLYSAMLVGATYAYFSDTITNSDNKIQSGILDISLFSTETNFLHVDPITGANITNPTVTNDVDITDSSAAVYTAANIAPGDSGYINLSVRPSATNTLSFAYKIYLTFADDMSDFFAQLGFKIDTTAVTYADADSTTDGTQILVKDGNWIKNGVDGANGANIDFKISWAFATTADNTFQNKTLSFDILVVADQIAVTA